MIKPHRITLLRDLTSPEPKTDSYIAPAGTPGLHIGIRSHLDLGYVRENGLWSTPLHGLPVFELLEAGKDYEDHGEWDGTQGVFTERGWASQPLLSFRNGSSSLRKGES